MESYFQMINHLKIRFNRILRRLGGSQGQKPKFSYFVICCSPTHGLSKMGSSSQLLTVAEIWVTKDTSFSRVFDVFYIGKEAEIEPQFKFSKCFIALQMLHWPPNLVRSIWRAIKHFENSNWGSISASFPIENVKNAWNQRIFGESYLGNRVERNVSPF